MKAKFLVLLAVLGIIGAIVSAHIYGSAKPSMPPVFHPSEDPYAKGIYANGIVESYLSSGENINIFPEVSGAVMKVEAVEGAMVTRGTPLLTVDSSVQKATVAQEKAQTQAALAVLHELRAEPRKEVLAVSRAQMTAAAASLKTAEDTVSKLKTSYDLDPRSVSRDHLDAAIDAVGVAKANLGTARKQYELTRAGAWKYDIRNQQHLYDALQKTYEAGKALLAKYTVRAPMDGVVLSIKTASGSYISPQGAYETYTESYGPVVVMAPASPYYQVRCYIDEILISKLPPISRMTAVMYPRGATSKIPLQFVRIQPYVIPKIELSNQKTERVDLRVLPVIFRFKPPKGVHIYPGMLVDVYLKQGGERAKP